MLLSLTIHRPAVLLIVATQILNFFPTTSAASIGHDRSRVGPRQDRRGELPRTLARRTSVEYDDPKLTGGSMLTIVNGTYPAGLGEPLNVILSAESDAAVLVNSSDSGGFLNYMLSTLLAEECLHEHYGDYQDANTGDGQGNLSEIQELRWDFGDPYIGSCEETFKGGLHLRYWLQETTGAYFMAVSVEENAAADHDIILDGYNLGRDYLVGNLTGSQVKSSNVTNQTTYTGTSTFDNYTYRTNVKYVSGLLNDSSDGINHYLTVETNNRPAIDGLVAVLTVTITGNPTSAAYPVLSGVSIAGLVSSIFLGGVLLLL